MDFLIDAQGRQQRSAADPSCAVWRKGFIHIRGDGHGIVVSLSPSLVKGPTVAGAVYAIADIDPQHISLILEKGNSIAVVFDMDWRTAFGWICELVAASRYSEEPRTAASHGAAVVRAGSELRDDPEQIITATLKRHVQSDPEALTRHILEYLWEAGYDVRPTHC